MRRQCVWLIFSVALFGSTYLSGCGTPADVVIELTQDQDGDGLDDARENELGTKPDSKDTDGDGFFDGAEVDSFTDPTDSSDHPYEGGWPIGSCRNDLSATGNAVGQVTDNFALPNQHGEILKLHDFCDKVVLLVGAAFW